MTGRVVTPTCPPWCESERHAPRLVLDYEDRGGALVVHHGRYVEHTAGWVEIGQDEPHPDMRMEDGYPNPWDFPPGVRVRLHNDQLGALPVPSDPADLRAQAELFVAAAEAVEEWLR